MPDQSPLRIVPLSKSTFHCRPTDLLIRKVALCQRISLHESPLLVDLYCILGSDLAHQYWLPPSAELSFALFSSKLIVRFSLLKFWSLHGLTLARPSFISLVKFSRILELKLQICCAGTVGDEPCNQLVLQVHNLSPCNLRLMAITLNAA